MTIQYPIGVNGNVTRVLEAGRGNDRKVVFVHGLSTRADRWAANLDPLAEAGYHAVAPDLPGHGLAEKPADFAYTVPGLADYLDGLMEVVGIDSAAFVATSFGAHVAAYLAVTKPERVERLAIVDGLGILPVEDKVAQGIRNAVRDTSKQGIEGKLANVFVDKSFATAELAEEEWRINNSPGALDALGKLGDYVADGLNGDVVTDRLRALQAHMPIMIVWGAQDQLVPLSVGEACAEALDKASFEVIDGTGHAPYLEKPEAFNRLLIERFL